MEEGFEERGDLAEMQDLPRDWYENDKKKGDKHVQ